MGFYARAPWGGFGGLWEGVGGFLGPSKNQLGWNAPIAHTQARVLGHVKHMGALCQRRP
jgi:hypothetical protein